MLKHTRLILKILCATEYFHICLYELIIIIVKMTNILKNNGVDKSIPSTFKNVD